jgi:hypothetical protein
VPGLVGVGGASRVQRILLIDCRGDLPPEIGVAAIDARVDHAHQTSVASGDVPRSIEVLAREVPLPRHAIA